MKFLQTKNDAFDIFGSLPTGLVVFFVIAIVFAIVAKSSPKKWRRLSQSKYKKKSNVVKFQEKDRGIADPKNQLEYIAKVGFATQRLLNKEEYPVLLLLESVTRDINKDLRVMAQTSLGEILTTTNVGSTKQDRYYAFRSINSKRLDFTVFDRTGTLILAVEYQGSGHYHAKSFIRDAVKREAVRKAGVQYLEISLGYNPSETADQVKRAIFKALRMPFPDNTD